MRTIICAFLIVFSFYSFGQKKVIPIDVEQLENYLFEADQDLTIFNFWATWCGPCIEELPHFDAIENQFPNTKVYFVSVDFPNQLEKVKSFVSSKNIKSSVLFMTEKDAEKYMKLIDSSWSGAIPATLFLKRNGKTYFHEKAFSKELLLKTVKTYLN